MELWEKEREPECLPGYFEGLSPVPGFCLSPGASFSSVWSTSLVSSMVQMEEEGEQFLQDHLQALQSVLGLELSAVSFCSFFLMPLMGRLNR